MKKYLCLILSLVFLFLINGCSNGNKNPEIPITSSIKLSDKEIYVDGELISSDSADAVYAAHDIIFYLEGQDFTYGAGKQEDEHSQAEADKHTVIHITKPGTYEIKGKLSLGQIAVDLGEEAENNPNAVVKLYLNGVKINCDIAPAIIFYNVYECGDKEVENATHNVDTTNAGANIIIANGSENYVSGSYVARIYKTYELSDDGKEVISDKKLHKYDGAIHSKMSINFDAESEADGVLNIEGTNEGIAGEMHITLYSGIINISSRDDGINANEDDVSVITLDRPKVNIEVFGYSNGEGDGIDSNGWIVINDGELTAVSHASIADDFALDASLGMFIYGGKISLS